MEPVDGPPAVPTTIELRADYLEARRHYINRLAAEGKTSGEISIAVNENESADILSIPQARRRTLCQSQSRSQNSIT